MNLNTEINGFIYPGPSDLSSGCIMSREYCWWFYLFILGLGWVFISDQAFPLVSASGGYSLVVVGRLLIAVASLVMKHQPALGSQGLRSCSSWALEHQLNSFGAGV